MGSPPAPRWSTKGIRILSAPCTWTQRTSRSVARINPLIFPGRDTLSLVWSEVFDDTIRYQEMLKLLDVISTRKEEYVILGGDFNTIFSPRAYGN